MTTDTAGNEIPKPYCCCSKQTTSGYCPDHAQISQTNVPLPRNSIEVAPSRQDALELLKRVLDIATSAEWLDDLDRRLMDIAPEIREFLAAASRREGSVWVGSISPQCMCAYEIKYFPKESCPMHRPPLKGGEEK